MIWKIQSRVLFPIKGLYHLNLHSKAFTLVKWMFLQCSVCVTHMWHMFYCRKSKLQQKIKRWRTQAPRKQKILHWKKNNKWILNFIGNIYIFVIGSKNIRSCIDDTVNNIFAQNLKFLKLLLKVQENYLFLPNVLNWKKSPIFSVEFPPWSFSGNGNWVRSWRGSQSVETAPVNREILID